ncbi:hypothetical protein B0H21DRAFT_676010, partial [Amylocystis lapponica]
LLLYISSELDDKDIPHRSKITKLIEDRYNAEKAILATEAQNALGRVSFTSDVWSDQQLRGFMAITVHYVVKDSHRRLQLKAKL